MCGRYANAQPPRQFTAAVRDRLRRRDRVQRGEDNAESSKAAQQEDASQSKDTHSDDADFIVSRVEEGDYHPTHNVSPSSRAPILRLEKPVPLPLDGEVNEVPKEGNDLIIECMRWGLLPARTTSIPHGVDALRTINARDDSVMSGQSMWTPLLKKGKRCIVFCQGFYEWLKKPDGTRIAHFCGMEDEGNGRVDVHGKQRALMPMAGLYEQCTIDGQPFLSFTIITTESNKQLNFLHDRMPVILPNAEAMEIWLGARPASSREVCSLLRPYDKGTLDLYPVPREVGRVGNDDKSFILPVSARKDGIAAAFGRSQKVEKDVNSETHAPIGEEMKAVDGDGKRKRQLDEDERLAKELQDKEEAAAKRPKLEEDERLAKSLQEEEEVDLKGPKIEEDDKVQKVEKSTPAVKEKDINDGERRPSSRFSPEPFNPPVSPPRPKGGYSKVDDDDRDTSPRKTSSKALAEAAKGTKDIRNFFGGK